MVMYVGARSGILTVIQCAWESTVLTTVTCQKADISGSACVCDCMCACVYIVASATVHKPD